MHFCWFWGFIYANFANSLCDLSNIQKYPTPRRLCQVFFIKTTEHNVHFWVMSALYNKCSNIVLRKFLFNPGVKMSTVLVNIVHFGFVLLNPYYFCLVFSRPVLLSFFFFLPMRPSSELRLLVNALVSSNFQTSNN